MRIQTLRRTALAVGVALTLGGCEYFEGDDVVVAPLPPAPDSFLLTSGGKLVGFNASSPSTASAPLAITGLGSGETVLGGDIRPADGLLYILAKTSTNGAKLYTVNTTTGAATAATAATLTNATGGAAITLAGGKYGVDFNPVADRLRVVGDNGENLRINVAAAASNTAVDANVNTGLFELAYTNSFSTSCQTDLFYLNANQLLLSAAPNGIAGVANTGRLVGATGQTATAAAFDIRTGTDGSNTLQAALTTAAGTSLFTLNTSTGVATSGGSLAVPSGETPVALIAPLPASAPAQAVGNMVAVTDTVPQKALTFNRPPAGSPGKLCSTNAISGLVSGDVIVGVDTRPADGLVYALTQNGSNVGKLYTLTAAGVAAAPVTLSANPTDMTAPFTALTGGDFGVDFNPVPDRLRVVSDTGLNLRINVASGATDTDEVTNDGTGAARNGVVGAAYTNSINDGGTALATLFTTLFAVDSTADMLVRIGGNPAGPAACTAGAIENNPNCGDVVNVGALGVDIGSATGLEIDPRNGVTFMTATVGATTSLFTLNLTTGAATAAGNFTEPVVGITGNGAVNATVFGVTPTNKLVSFRPDAPATVTAVGTITGLTAGDTLVGLDFRPSIGANNGRLVAMAQNGGAGRLYVIDPATAAATLLSTLGADATDMTAPFAALTGPNFGLDFNPQPDRLRVVSEAAENLRINVNSNTGVTTDTSLSGATGNGVFGAAYTNNFTTTASTALFYLVDGLAAANSTLATTADPNGGALTVVGTDLGADFSKIGDFDIAGGQNGFVLAALQPAAAGVSGLFRIDLGTGSAGTKLGDIVTAGSEPLVGLAIRLQ